MKETYCDSYWASGEGINQERSIRIPFPTVPEAESCVLLQLELYLKLQLHLELKLYLEL